MEVLGVEAAEMVVVPVAAVISGMTGEAGRAFGVVDTADIRAFLTVEDILAG